MSEESGTFSNPKRLYDCTCSNCKNSFSVPYHDEFLPSYCCYCGEEFEELGDEEEYGYDLDFDEGINT